MKEIDALKQSIVELRHKIPAARSLLAGISGIDASGKGFVTSKLADALSDSFKVAVINVDAWLNLPNIRFGGSDPGRHFYHNALRLVDLFNTLILPLKQDREVDLLGELLEETSTAFQPHRYCFFDIDIILLEGIFLFKLDFVKQFDIRIWVECSFATALERAVVRSQEGLSRSGTISAYENIYFPAQRIHFAIDDPRSAADLTFENG